MKMKSILGAVLAGALALGSTLAYAQAGPIYLTPKLLYSHQMTDSFNGTLSHFDFNTDYSGPDKTDNVFGGGLAIGYDFGAVGYAPFRAELEFLARGGSEVNYGRNVSGNDLGAPIFSTYTLQNKVYSLFANIYYDFANDSDFTPYIGGGIGGAYVDSTFSGRHECITIRNGFFDSNGNTSSWNFAWNLGGGVAYQISDLLALDFGYRYSDFGEVDTSSRKHQNLTTNTGVMLPLRAKAKADLSAHEFILGLRISGY